MRNKKRETRVGIVDTVGYKSNILPHSYSFLTELEGFFCVFFSEPSTHPIHNQMLQKMQALYTDLWEVLIIPKYSFTTIALLKFGAGQFFGFSFNRRISKAVLYIVKYLEASLAPLTSWEQYTLPSLVAVHIISRYSLMSAGRYKITPCFRATGSGIISMLLKLACFQILTLFCYSHFWARSLF